MLLVFFIVVFFAWCLIDDSKSFTFKLFVAIITVGLYYYYNSPYSVELRQNLDAWAQSFHFRY